MQLQSNSYSDTGSKTQALIIQAVQKRLERLRGNCELEARNKELLINDNYLKGDSFYIKSSF